MCFNKEKTLFFKGIAIIFMVLLHLFGQPELNEINYISIAANFGNPEEIIGSFGKICISIYIFLSGYGISKSKTKIYSRIKTIYLNYIVAMLLFLPFLLKDNFNLLEMIKNLLGISHTYNGYL